MVQHQQQLFEKKKLKFSTKKKAIFKGVIHVGLTSEDLDKLGKIGTKCKKVSRRDVALCVSQKLDGATTVSGTMVIASKVGIKVFVTGGIGGVHREVNETLDISADLTELGRTPICVVSAGVKSILDIPKTCRNKNRF